MICQACGASFTPKHPRERYCSGKCRVAAWERRKTQFQDDRDRRLRYLLEEAMKVLSEGER